MTDRILRFEVTTVNERYGDLPEFVESRLRQIQNG